MKPLAGMTVLEFSTMITASFAAMMMAEQGARVIKIEPVGMGDPMRYIGTQKGGISALFANCNRGKEAISVNLKDEVGQALVHRLVETADVVIHNFRPGVMEGLNLGSEKLRAINPRLVYMAISGFGKEGPLKNAPAYDPVIQAHAGFTASQGKHGPSGDAPAFVRNLMCDKITAYTAIQGVTAALLLREREGLGQHIDLSMLDSGLFFIFPDGFMNNTLMDDDIQIQPLLSDLLYELTITKDGAITISAGTDQQRNNLLRALGLEALSEDERFSTLDALLQNFQAYRDILAVKFLQFTSDDILVRLRKWDVPAAKCHTYEEVLMQPQIDANDTLEVRHHPEMGSMRIIKSPVKFAGERLSPGQHSPTHGQHTITVLKELGLDDLTIESYKQDGVI
ncbi:MAG: crotonobetainyl-CoA:carnitine CoA-transferase CaiB-like acyl-CoA transferase [Candidatus Azotimanducaceae bacterium]|jgi:crotonobetainyl-CoA:carnitine CoA-transferase CaiB-like acyl-CoA transferase